jgi:hypothetical protein
MFITVVLTVFSPEDGNGSRADEGERLMMSRTREVVKDSFGFLFIGYLSGLVPGKFVAFWVPSIQGPAVRVRTMREVKQPLRKGKRRTAKAA